MIQPDLREIWSFLNAPFFVGVVVVAALTWIGFVWQRKQQKFSIQFELYKTINNQSQYIFNVLSRMNMGLEKLPKDQMFHMSLDYLEKRSEFLHNDALLIALFKDPTIIELWFQIRDKLSDIYEPVKNQKPIARTILERHQDQYLILIKILNVKMMREMKLIGAKESKESILELKERFTRLEQAIQ